MYIYKDCTIISNWSESFFYGGPLECNLVTRLISQLENKIITNKRDGA